MPFPSTKAIFENSVPLLLLSSSKKSLLVSDAVDQFNWFPAIAAEPVNDKNSIGRGLTPVADANVNGIATFVVNVVARVDTIVPGPAGEPVVVTTPVLFVHVDVIHSATRKSGTELIALPKEVEGEPVSQYSFTWGVTVPKLRVKSQYSL